MSASPLSPWMMLVSSTNALMLSVTRTSQITDLMHHGVASDWYAVISKWDISIHLIAASPVP